MSPQQSFTITSRVWHVTTTNTLPINKIYTQARKDTI